MMLNLTLVVYAVSWFILVGLAIYIQVSANSLTLPLSLGTTIFTILLPFLSAANVYYTPLFQHSPRLAKYPFVIQLGPAALQMLQGMLTVVLATLFAQGLFPGRELDCSLQETWKRLWMAHDGASIGRIQDAFNCCGLNSDRHMSWPPSKAVKGGGPSLCSEMNHRTLACAGPWRSTMQLDSGLGFAIAVITGIFQLIFLVRERKLSTGRSSRSYMRITEAGDDEDVNDGALLAHDEHSSGAAPTGGDNTRQVQSYGALGNGSNPRIEPTGLGN